MTNPDKPCSLCGKPSICSERGVILYDVPVEHPLFGKMQRCPNRTADQDSERQEKLRKLSNLAAFAGKTFASFVIDVHLAPYEQQSLRSAYEIAFRFASETPLSNRWLLLKGAYGCGKTHLAAAIGNERIKRGDEVLFITTPDLLDHLRSAFGPTSETGYDELFDRVRNVPLLILDDLGVENPSQWAQEKLFQLLNHRYANRIPTVITTNVSVDSFDPRIRSRLLDAEFISPIHIEAPDFRSAQQNMQDDVSMLAHYRQMRFNTFDVSSPTTEERRRLEFVLKRAMQFAEDPHGWLIVLGKHGTGKTHVASAIANHLAEHGHQVIFSSVLDLLDRFRSTFAPNTPGSFDNRFYAVRSVPFLILDDVGVDGGSNWSKDKLFQILDFRYVTQMPTIVTTSRALEELDGRLSIRFLDDRLCERLALEVEPYALRFRR